MNQPCLKSELSLFDGALTQVTMQQAMWMDVHPSTGIDGNSPIEFVFSGQSEDYLDLNDTLLYLKLKVTDKAGANLAAASVATPTNNLLSSLFSDVSLTLNDCMVEGGHFLYPYKGMISTLLQFDSSVKTTQLEAAGYQATIATRKAWIAGSKSCELAGPLHLDLFSQSKYLLPGVNVRIKMIPSKADFVIQNGGTAGDVKIVFEKAVLYVRKVKVNPAVLRAHESGMSKVGNAIYPIQQSELMTFTIPTGSTYHMQDNLFHGLVPKLIIIGMVTNTAFNGNANTSPMLFEHFKINHLALYKDGISIPYSQPIPMDFGADSVIMPYMALIQNLEMYNINVSNAITMEKFKNGSTLFVFNTTPDLNYGGAVGQPFTTANLRLEMKFGTALAQSINVIIMSISDGRIEISKERSVFKS